MAAHTLATVSCVAVAGLVGSAAADVLGTKYARMSVKGGQFDVNGYDRHGYDVFGFDTEGYDIMGRPVTDEFAGVASGKNRIAERA